MTRDANEPMPRTHSQTLEYPDEDRSLEIQPLVIRRPQCSATASPGLYSAGADRDARVESTVDEMSAVSIHSLHDRELDKPFASAPANNFRRSRDTWTAASGCRRTSAFSPPPPVRAATSAPAVRSRSNPISRSTSSSSRSTKDSSRSMLVDCAVQQFRFARGRVYRRNVARKQGAVSEACRSTAAPRQAALATKPVRPLGAPRHRHDHCRISPSGSFATRTRSHQ